jgi:hypothetical protein
MYTQDGERSQTRGGHSCPLDREDHGLPEAQAGGPRTTCEVLTK